MSVVSPVPASRLAKLSAMLGLCFVIMLIALDQTVVGTAMPRIIADLKGYDLYPWTASAYLLTNAIMMLVAGRLGDLHGRKPFVLISIVVFTAASALCGLARSMPELIAARVLQGVGGGTLSGVAFACITDLFPDRLQRIRWQAMLSATFGVSSAVGPTLGGFLTEHYGWRTVFFVNLPVALVAFPVVWRFLPGNVPHPEDKGRGLDWLGVGLFAGGISLLLLGVENGQSAGFLRALPLVMITIGALLCVLFLRHQLEASAPILPARLLRNPTIIRMACLSVLAGAALFLLVFYSPLLLQGGLGRSPRLAGLTMTPLLVCITLGSILNGRLMPRLRRPERILAYGFLGLGVCSLLMSLIFLEYRPGALELVFACCGFSLGFQLPNLTLQMQYAAERRDIGVASALVQTSRVIGSLIGATLGALVVNGVYHRQMAAVIQTGLGDAHAGAAQLLASPQILVRAQEQTELQQLAQSGHFDASALLESARKALVTSVHVSYAFCALLSFVALWVALKVKAFPLQPQTEQASGKSAAPHPKA